jgi:hypothetical protein
MYFLSSHIRVRYLSGRRMVKGGRNPWAATVIDELRCDGGGDEDEDEDELHERTLVGRISPESI